jgi:hypothetical protein
LAESGFTKIWLYAANHSSKPPQSLMDMCNYF